MCLLRLFHTSSRAKSFGKKWMGSINSKQLFSAPMGVRKIFKNRQTSQLGVINWINVIVLLLLTSFALTFAVANEGLIQLSFLGFVSQEIPLYVPIFLAFLLGFAGGVLSLSFSRRKHKREIIQLRQDNTRLAKEVENLRNIPLQDDV